MVQKKKDVVTLVGVGDVRPNRDDPPSMFRYCGDILRSADIAFGQLEAPLCEKGTPMFVPHAGPQWRSPKNITAYTEQGAGFDVMSFASNTTMDWGWAGLRDTLDLLKRNKIEVVGAGKNIDEARRPVILERKGTKVGFLGYLSIVSLGSIAEDNWPGCAPLRSSHSYQQVDYQAGTPPLIITKLFPEDREAMEEDIKKLRSQVDVVVVSMHCGLHFVRAVIPMYQREAAYAAIDAGADLVLQHHTHILKGIEMYKGKAIFYSLANFANEPNSPGGLRNFYYVGRSLPEFYRKYTHIRPEPGYENHHTHRDALKTLIAKAYIQDKKIQKVTYIPAYIRPNYEPEVVTRQDPKAQDVFNYVDQISEEEELNVSFSWEGDEVLVSDPRSKKKK